jgi:hypothetical protein
VFVHLLFEGAKAYEIQLNCSMIAGRFELLPLVYNPVIGDEAQQWMKYAPRLQHNGVGSAFFFLNKETF